MHKWWPLKVSSKDNIGAVQSGTCEMQFELLLYVVCHGVQAPRGQGARGCNMCGKLGPCKGPDSGGVVITSMPTA